MAAKTQDAGSPKIRSPRSTKAPARPRKTSSPRGGSGAGPRDPTVARPLKPFTLDHFRAYCRNQVLDTGKPWEIEDFQLEISRDIFAGIPEVLVVIPEGNAKTTLMAGHALYHGDYLTGPPQVLLAASSRDQAGILLQQADGFVTRSSAMAKRFRVFEGYRRIGCLRSGGRIQVFAADDRTGDGVLFDRAFVDELHRARDLRLWRTWAGKLEKRDAQIVGISTAGEPDSEFEELRARARDNAQDVQRGECYLRAASARSVLHDWSVPRGCEDDLALVKAANPLSTITVARLASKLSSPSMRPAHWKRFTCNIATSEEDQWIPTEAIDACVGTPEITADDPSYGGVDVGTKKDRSAVVAVQLHEDLVHVRQRILVPAPKRPVAIADTRQAVLDLHSELVLTEAAYDPHMFRESAELLEEQGVVMVEFPQTHARMGPASESLYEVIMDGRLVFDGDPEARRHLLAARAQQTDSGVRISKGRSRSPIDFTVALAMAVDRLLRRGSGAPAVEVW